MEYTNLGFPKPEVIDGGRTTEDRQAFIDLWNAAIEDADANIQTVIGTGGGQVDTAANFTASNPTLNENQFGYESDTGKFKLGDGVTAWNSLAYYFDGSGTGDVTGGSASTDGEVVVYDGGTGKAVKRSNTLTGVAKVTAGVLDVCSNLTDVAYEAAANKGQANGYAPLDGDSLVPTENLPAGMGSGDVLGAGTPVVGDIAQYTNVDGKHISPITRTYYNAVDHGSAVRHASNDIGATFRAWIAGLSNCVVVFPPCTAGTYYNFTSDLETIPATVLCVFQRGAVLNIGTVSVTGNLTCSFTAGVNTITTYNSSAYVSNVDSGILPGQYIKTAGNNYYRVHQMVGTDCIINSLVGVAAGEAGVAFSASPLVIGGADLDTQFEHGDIAYVSGLTLPISRVKDATHIWTYDWIPQEFNAAATRSVRVKFPGSIKAGRYQIFKGDGVAKLDHMNTPKVYPEWWGATANGVSGNTTTNKIALTKASTCFLHGTSTETTASIIKLASGDYYVDGPVKYGCITIKGTGSGTYTGKSCIRAAASPFPGIAVMEPYPNIQNINTSVPNTSVSTGAPTISLKHFQIHSDYKLCANGYVVDCLVESGGIDIEDLAYQNGGCAVRSLSGNLRYIERCFMSGMENGYFLSNEGYIRGCKGQWGAQLVASTDFSDGSKWTSTGWVLSGSKATHTAGNTSSLTQNVKTQGGTGAYPYAPGVPMLIKLIISGGTTGTLVFKSFGGTVQGTYGTAGTYYYWVNTPMDIWTNPLSVEIIPSSDFDKAVQVWIYYGGAFYGCSTTVTDNDFWSDGPLGAFGFYPVQNYVRLSNNFIHPCGIGAVLESGKFYNNGFDSCLFGGIISYCAGFVAEGNIFSTSGVGGIHIPAGMTETEFSLFRDNVFDNGAVTNFFGWSNGSQFPTGYSQLIIEDNLRADKAAEIAMDTGTATPSVLLGKRFTLTNGSAQDITNFVDGYLGKEITIRFLNGNTTIKFSDANHYLKGNSAADWTPVTGDILKATFNGSTWDCTKYSTS